VTLSPRPSQSPEPSYLLLCVGLFFCRRRAGSQALLVRRPGLRDQPSLIGRPRESRIWWRSAGQRSPTLDSATFSEIRDRTSTWCKPHLVYGGKAKSGLDDHLAPPIETRSPGLIHGGRGLIPPGLIQSGTGLIQRRQIQRRWINPVGGQSSPRWINQAPGSIPGRPHQSSARIDPPGAAAPVHHAPAGSIHAQHSLI
jgi:hypothetical protein